MQTQVVTVSPDAPLFVVQRLFYEEGIHGAPVVDEQGRVQGVITSTDILRAAAEDRETAPVEPSYFRGDLDYHGFDWGRAPIDLKERLDDTIVSDAMTSEVVAVSPAASVAEIAQTLRQNKVHRVLVMEGDVLRGIISAFDLVQILESGD
jgi:CBS domain-containing protein